MRSHFSEIGLLRNVINKRGPAPYKKTVNKKSVKRLKKSSTMTPQFKFFLIPHAFAAGLVFPLFDGLRKRTVFDRI